MVEIEDLIGFFVNTQVLRTDLSGNPTFRQLLERIREVALGAYAHQDLPFEKLVEEFQPQRDLSRTPLFQVMFAFRNEPRRMLQLSDLMCELENITGHTAKFDMMLAIEERDGLVGTFEYNTDLFDARTIARMAEHFLNILAGITADPDQHLYSLPVLSEEEQKQLLLDWNDNRSEYVTGACIHTCLKRRSSARRVRRRWSSVIKSLAIKS